VAAVGLIAATAVPLLSAPAAASPPADVGRIVYSTDTGSRLMTGEIWTMSADGADHVRLTDNAVFDGEPAWSPDGTRIAFASGPTNSPEIWVMNADGTGAARLTVNAEPDSSPTWSPDGFSIAFVRRGVVRIMNADGTGERALFPNTSGEEHPDWSPDGQWIAFGRGGEVFKAHPDGSALQRLTAATGSDSMPAWSPDGDQIAFVSSRQGTTDVFTMSPDGTAQVAVTTSSAFELRPSWTPDGSAVLYDVPGATVRQLARTVPGGGGTTLLTDETVTRIDADAVGERAAIPTQPPGTAVGSTSAGQSMTVAVTSPADGTRLPATTDPLAVTGTVDLSAASGRPYHAAYVVDVSGSTAEVQWQDCDGSGTVTIADEFNSAPGQADILDCEIAGVIALNNAVKGVPGATVGVVALGGGQVPLSAMADMSPAVGDQPSTLAAAHTNTTGRADVEHVLRSLSVGRIGAYTPKSVGTGTHYDSALRMVNDHFRVFEPGGTNVAYFLSDGEPNNGTFTTTTAGPLHAAKLRGTRIFTYAVAQPFGCYAGKPLRIIADTTGGTCTAVTNPSLVGAAVSTPATLSAVHVQLGNGTSVPATLDTTTTPATWQASLPGLPPGVHTLRATAVASDGSSVTAALTVTGTAVPVVDAGGPYALPEGSSLVLAGSATDADSPSLQLVWSPADRLTGATTATPTYAGDDDRVEVLTLEAVDGDGLRGSATATVETLNVAPTLGAVSLAPRPITGSETTVSVPFTDPGTLDTHTGTVDWGDGTVEAATITPAAGGGDLALAHTYTAGGEYTITVTVTDDDGGQATAEHGPFRVNTTPEVDAGGPYVVTEGTALSLAGTASDADGDPLTLTWSPSAGLADPSSATSAYDTTDDSSAQLTLTADDGDLSATSQTSVTVNNVAPSISALTGPAGVIAPGTPVTVDLSWTDPGVADTHEVVVDWGDQAVQTLAGTGGAATLTHTYAGGGAWTVTVTVTDDDGGADVATTTVYTNRPPTVDAGDDLTVDEGSLTQLAATATDPDGDPLTLSWTPSSAVTAATAEDPFVEAVDDGVITLTLTAIDRHGASASDSVDVTVRNVAPVVTALAGPAEPQPVGTPVSLSGSYTDAGSADTHTATVSWGDGTTSAGTATGGALSAQHTYTAPGVYTVAVEVTDDDGGVAQRSYEYVVVYDPQGGFVTGGGSFDSPAGAYPADPTATGRATFGFTARYAKGRSVPDGQTQFQFKAGGLSFHSTSYDWLVVAGTRATYRGVGEVNGTAGYSFQLSAVDGQRPGGDKVDRFRLKVWSTATGELVYDNQVGTTDDAAPTTALTGGSVVIHG
jgi:hypothetical protein